MTTIKLTKIGNSVGGVFPKETLARLNVNAGDSIHLTAAPGGYRLTPYDPAFEKQMEVAERVMKRRRTVLRKLAK